jgi:hypothetical protein
MDVDNFDLGVELAGLLQGEPTENKSGRIYGDFPALIAALRPYLSAEQSNRLDRALEMAELLKAAKQILPRIGGALGVQ